MPSAVPSTITPNVDNGSVRSIAQVGNTMVIGGDFTSIGGSTQNYVAAFDATTGKVSTTFNPAPNGAVYSVIPGPNDHTVYIGGSFTQVAGSAAKFVAELDTNTGALVPGFNPPTFDYGQVNDLKTVGNRLFVGGFFSKVGGKSHLGLASLNATTGAVDPFMNVQLSGHHNDSGSGAQGYIGTWSFDISPNGARMAVIGNFKNADGLLRDQLAMIDLDGSAAQVDPNWSTTRYSPLCFNWAFDAYVRGVSFSPDGSYFVVNATGGGNAGTLCDATSRFETASTGTNIQPTWVDETGGDTVWGVTITDDAVYIGGHNRWNNNPLGVDHAQPGAVPRPGLAALDPVSGRPLTWNPGHNPLGAAVYALLATPKGLWMGWDQNWIGNFKYKRQKIAFFPYAGGSTLASTATATLPGTVYLGSSAGGAGATNVLYRVDAGGSAVQSTDTGPDWLADTSDTDPGAAYRNKQSNAAGWGAVGSVDSTVPSTTPSTIFSSERWSPTDSPPMTWDFPVKAGTNVAVRLYFANQCSCTQSVGQRVFNVALNGQQVLNNYDIVKDVGNETGTMKEFSVTVPSSGTYAGDVDLSFTHVTENPLVNGIEIINKDAPTPPASGSGTLSTVSFDGTTASQPQSSDTGGINWSQVRGAFMVGSYVYYGYTDGYLYRAALTSSGFGTPQQVNPYMDPVWDGVDTHDGTTFDGALPSLYGQMSNVTGMFYSGGRLYYTMYGDSALHWRWFSPDSGIVDETSAVAPSSVSFSDADGTFVSNGTLYYGTRSNGNLNSVAFNDGTVSGSSSVVSGPGKDGINWTNRAMFLSSVGGSQPPVNQAPVASFTSSCTYLACSFDGSKSSDSDGTVVSYAWDFGDNSTGSGANLSHTYAKDGTYTVKLTVTDNQGATGTVSKSVVVANAPQNQPPVASFTYQCTGTTCTFDGSKSSDPDGTVTGYDWKWGDSSADSSGSTASHTYDATGTYTVTLTVTDNDGATNRISQDVTASTVPANDLAFVGVGHGSGGVSKFKQAAIPSTASVGDTALLFFTQGNTANWSDPTGVSGWTQVAKFTNATITSTLWAKTLTASDLGGTVRLNSPDNNKAMLTVAVYHGVDASTLGAPTVAHVGDSSTATHTTPSVSATAGDWIVSYWADKTGSTDATAWTAPSSVSTRDTTVDTGTGRYDSLLADSGASVPGGSNGGLTANSGAISEKTAMWTLDLRPSH
ncbi:conserved hypothetical protein [Nostocoides japonicum T1-X7]|uniref:PKD domain-containing protein n=1 Tax=Nostocoides japonicum T1-X7 TaxID=1194083 RepID=A0A077LZ82_9MICO|nr:PKD domain-containing protein [Tetrasphaera japonica]CCH79203.1 conserved hypothetical protein [Tetrasphaera japonica T1-X7]